jgi:hypothetical protein
MKSLEKLFAKEVKERREKTFKIAPILFALGYGVSDLYFIYKAYGNEQYGYAALAAGHLVLLAIVLDRWDDNFDQITKSVHMIILIAGNLMLINQVLG